MKTYDNLADATKAVNERANKFLAFGCARDKGFICGTWFPFCEIDGDGDVRLFCTGQAFRIESES